MGISGVQKVLSQVARVIHGVLGPDDSLVRYGGDEFIVLLPRPDPGGGPGAHPPLRRTLKQSPFWKMKAWTSRSPPASASPPCRRTPRTREAAAHRRPGHVWQQRPGPGPHHGGPGPDPGGEGLSRLNRGVDNSGRAWPPPPSPSSGQGRAG